MCEADSEHSCTDRSDIEAGAGAKKAKRPRVAKSAPLVIDEMVFHLEDRSDSTDQHYVRYRLSCPLSSTLHCAKQPCMKRRNIGSQQCFNFGRWEPVGYLACWHRARDRFPDKASHMEYEPPLKDVEAWLADRGYI